MTEENYWTAGHRADAIKELQQSQVDDEVWDMIIIGGGITAAGIAREAGRRGLRTLLLERQDFAWGTSSRSSKMVHGGLRYMASGDIKTTLHSVHERERLMNEAPGLVDRMDYMMAHYRGQFPGRTIFNLLLAVYDIFAGKKYRQFVPRKQLEVVAPGIRLQGLIGGTQFSDAVTDDSRLVMRVLHEALADDVVALNYCGVNSVLVENGKVCGVQAEDVVGGEKFKLHSHVVINATGAWADELRGSIGAEKKIRPARGSHIVIPAERLAIKHSFTVLHPDDKRPVFVYPWEGRTVIGTTDLDNGGIDNREVGITAGELNYLLKLVDFQFPGAEITAADIISTWAGVRPLVSSGAKNSSKEKRDHSIWDEAGLVSVSGGKLTTFRLIALDVIAAARRYIPEFPSGNFSENIFHKIPVEKQQLNVADKQLNRRLLGFYGRDAQIITRRNEADNERIPGTVTLYSELRWSAGHEAVIHLDDLLLRRTRLGLILKNGGMNSDDTEQKIAAICSEELGWNNDKWLQERSRYLNIWQHYYSLPADS